MSQPNLLELAKQGDPLAIATLMNLTLEPKGVTATAFLAEDCLHVSLTSARTLNAKTLVDFTQRGILSLGIQSVQWVKICGHKPDDDQPDWVESFAVNQTQTDSLHHEPSSDTDLSDFSPAVGLPPSRHDVAALMNRCIEQSALLKTQLQVYWGKALTGAQQRSHQMQARQKAFLQDSLSVLPTHIWTGDYLKLSMAVTLVAFVTGGTAAFIANSYAVGSSDRKAGATASANATNSQLALNSEAERHRQQQDGARQYLETMNKAQQTFYRQNNRFASTLEELERFAAVPIASRSDYTYKLTAPSRTQSQLSAVPKASGLKSYTAAVSIAKATNQTMATICTSQQAAKAPPLVFQSPEGTVQCPVESGRQ